MLSTRLFLKTCAQTAALLLFVSINLHAADGDITGVQIETNGWIANVFIASSGAANTNGTFTSGLGTNNTLTGTERMRITIGSWGFDDTGSTCTVQRVVYGTKLVRFPYGENGQHNFPDTTNDGTNLRIRVALSDYIYAADTISNAALASAMYATNTLSSASATWTTVTNSSGLAYPKVIGNWSQVNWEIITNTTFLLRCVAFHSFAQSGRPVRAVRFVAQDQAGNSNFVIKTTAQIDTDSGDAVPVVEYIATMDATSFTQGNVITNNFIAYPWIGDASSCLDTSASGNAQPTPLPAPHYFLCDKIGSYGTTMAIVDASGNDATGYATNIASFTLGNEPGYCATIAGAASKIAAYNNSNYSRNDTGAGVIYLKSGSYNWTGGTPSAGGSTEPKTWLTIRAYPGTDRSTVIITNQAGSKKICDKVKISNLTWFWSAGGTKIFVDSEKYIWFDGCLIKHNGDAGVYRCTNMFHTRNIVSTVSDGFFRAFSSTVSHPALIRGNVITNCYIVHAYTMIGNYFPCATNTQISDYVTSSLQTNQYPIIAYNIIQSWNQSSAPIWIGMDTDSMLGFAIVQNLVTKNLSTSLSGAMVSGDSSTNKLYSGLMWYNTIVGGNSARCNMVYNDIGTNYVSKQQIRINNNIFDDYNIKSDTFNHPTAGRSGNRTGNWSEVNGVGYSGNLFAEVKDRAGNPAATFQSEFPGLGSIDSLSGNSSNFVAFTANQSYSGPTSGIGDYTLTPNSPARGLASEWLLPYDISGHARYSGGAAGAYEYGITNSGSTIRRPVATQPRGRRR